MPWSGLADIGANPKGEASRANREGRVVLYCADQEKTAIAEVRPARGFLVSVAAQRLKADLRVFGLTKAQEPINPFIDEGETIPYWLALDDLLTRMAWALAMPLERDDDKRDYRPSQILAEYAEERGFDGIRYPSAMLRGTTNIVFFNPDTCDFVSSELVKVTEVEVEYTRDPWQLTRDFVDL